MNYDCYILNKKEKRKVLLLAAIVTATIGFLFYDSFWPMLMTPIAYVFIKKKQEKAKLIQRKSELTKEFLDVMRVVLASLLAGYSTENAWLEAQREMEHMYGTKSMIYLELEEINHAVALSVPIEQLLIDFANRTGIDDIISFADVFSFAKRTGGDLVKLMETTTSHILRKNETIQEIELMIASKKYEQKVMNVIPVFMIIYLRFTSAGYFDALYKNVLGGMIMTVALLIYAASIYLANKIMNIVI